MNFETLLVNASFNHDEINGSITTPIYQTATFRHPGIGESTGYDYSRTSNPTRKCLEDLIASMENGYQGFAFSTGMAAITCILTLFSKNDYLIVSDDLYGGTYRLFEKIFNQFGIKAIYVDTSNSDEVSKAVNKDVKGVFIETPTNPMMKVASIKKISEICKKNNLLLIVDNTFMTPYLQTPIKLGADIVVHSATKYLSGHNDVLCGLVVASNKELSEKIGFIQNATGGVLSPFESFLTIRGIKTLSVRLDRSMENAGKIVDYLLKNSNVTEVFYPGIKNFPNYEIHNNQAKGPGAMISFKVKTKELAEKIINNVKIINFAESLGGVESLITYPHIQTHSDIPEDIRERLGINNRLLRLSIGIENVNDLIDDLNQAMSNN